MTPRYRRPSPSPRRAARRSTALGSVTVRRRREASCREIDARLTWTHPQTPSNSPAPTFQLTQYYRYGELDSCAGRWAAIWACMDKSKRYARGTGRGRGFAIARKYPSVALRAGLHPTPSRLTRPSCDVSLPTPRSTAQRWTELEREIAREGGRRAGEGNAVLGTVGPERGGGSVAQVVWEE
jgi:hypothetical protein